MTDLQAIPVPNQAVIRHGGGRFSVPLRQPAWVRWVRPVFPISKEKNVQLDKLGAEIYALCDGRRTVEEIIDLHKDRWRLSFFESRAMILQFLRQLLERNLIVLLPPRDGTS
jgi:hypothetical protein